MIRFFLLYLIIFSGIYASEFAYGREGFNGFTFRGTREISNRDKAFQIELEKSHSTPTILFLDFENKDARKLKDNNNRYKILNSYYSVMESSHKMGKRHASFSAKNSYISVQVSKNQFLSKTEITEKFYISFFIIPGDLEKNSNIISKSYITRGKRYGLEINLVNNKVQVGFYNMFRLQNGKSRTIVLKSQDSLPTGKWTHIALSIDPLNGKIALFENGVRKDFGFGYLSKEEPTILPFGFHPNDTSPLFIGKHFYGKMDNFFIGTGDPDLGFLESPYQKVEYDAGSKTVEQFYGEAYSPVLKTRYSNAIPNSLEYDVNSPKGTYYEILYRYSKTPFLPEAEDPQWKNVNDFQVVNKKEARKNESLFPIRFQYFQWKVLLRSDHKGMSTPAIKKLSLKYSNSYPPDPPIGLRVDTETTKLMQKETPSVCISWNSNHEKSVNKNGGGYIIQYGVTPNRMVASLYIDKNGGKITGLNKTEALGQYYKNLKLCIDNSLISKNALLQKDKSLLTLKKGITYYFKVSAYNEFFDYNYPTRYLDQISKPSKSISITLPNYSSGYHQVLR